MLCSKHESHFTTHRPIILQRVDEIRPVVTRHPDLICSLASMHVVPRATPPLCILALERRPHEHCTAKQEQRHVGEHHTVAGVVSWLLILEEDVGRDDTVDVASTNDNADDHTSLVHAFNVVAAPREGVGSVCSIRSAMQSVCLPGLYSTYTVG